MKKPSEIKAKTSDTAGIEFGVKNPSDQTSDQLKSDMGKERNHIAKVLLDVINSFKATGKHSQLMAQSINGRKFQQLCPTVRRFSKQNPRIINCIDIKVGMLPTLNTELGPGFEYNPVKVRSIVQRVFGPVQLEVVISGGSSEETALFVWAIKQILTGYVFRLYRGLIYNESENWQVSFPKALDFSPMLESEDYSGEDSLTAPYWICSTSFEVQYECLFIESAEKQQVKTLVKSEPYLHLIPSNFDPQDISKGSTLIILLESNEKIKSAEIHPKYAASFSLNEAKTVVKIFINSDASFELIINTKSISEKFDIHVRK